MIRTGLRSSLLGLLVKPFFGRSWKNGFWTSKRLQWSRTAGRNAPSAGPPIVQLMGYTSFAIFAQSKDTAAYERSIACHKKAIELNPKDPSSHHGLGFTYLQGGRPAEAIPELKKALELFPDYGTAYYNLGLAYFYTGDYERAYDNLSKFKEKYADPLTPAQLRRLDSLIQKCKSKLDAR